tara:strand:+ start:2604 stop:3845 length:1242 start_codon:yes stop_codon:yes gene_type:complete
MKAYPAYKDSGIEWLGEIPAHWEIRNLKYVATLQRGFDLPSEEREKGEIPIYSSGGLSGFHSEKSVDAPCVVTGRYGTIGVFYFVEEDFWALNTTLYCKNFWGNDEKFVWYLLQSISWLFIQYSLKSKVPGVDRNDIHPESVSLSSSITEQKEITTHLDRRTQQIDRLLEIKSKQIELLKEQRTAIINQAVTKGLNPEVPMKDSGIEWLGEIPEGWEARKFNHSASITSRQIDPRDEPYCDYILIAPNHIEKETGRLLDTETAKAQGADSGKYLCKKDQVIYSKIRPHLAKVCMCPSDNVLCSADMYPISTSKILTNKFLYFFMLSDIFTDLATLESERVAMPKINRESLGEFKIPIPPIEEQHQLISKLDKTIEKIDKTIESFQTQINQLKEYRTALISEVVTGKIDVREQV